MAPGRTLVTQTHVPPSGPAFMHPRRALRYGDVEAEVLKPLASGNRPESVRASPSHALVFISHGAGAWRGSSSAQEHGRELAPSLQVPAWVWFAVGPTERNPSTVSVQDDHLPHLKMILGPTLESNMQEIMSHDPAENGPYPRIRSALILGATYSSCSGSLKFRTYLISHVLPSKLSLAISLTASGCSSSPN